MAGFSLLAGGEALAEEAVQEALVRAWERGQRGEVIESLTAWVAAVAANLLRSSVRRRILERRTRGRLAPSNGPDPRSDASSDERLDLGRAIRALPTRQRQVVVLRYFADLRPSEIGRALGIREGAVRVALHRARASLAAALAVPDPRVVGSDVAAV